MQCFNKLIGNKFLKFFHLKICCSLDILVLEFSFSNNLQKSNLSKSKESINSYNKSRTFCILIFEIIKKNIYIEYFHILRSLYSSTEE